MNCNETFNAGVCYVTDAYKRVCRFNEELHADLEKYRTENAKLRELVRTLVHCLNDVDCDKCPLNGNPYEVRGEWAACDALLDRMRKLGIEVD